MNNLVVKLDNALKFSWWVYLLTGVVAYTVLAWWLPATGLTRLTGDVATWIAPSLLAVFVLLAALKLAALYKLRHQAGTVDIGAIRKLGWDEFGALVSESFERKGYTVRDSEAKRIDFVMTREGRKYIVDCKYWKSPKVRRPEVEAFFSVMAAVEAEGGFMITTGVFDTDAEDFARGKNIRLIDSDALRDLLSVLDASTTRGAKQRYEQRKYSEQVTGKREIECPQCGRPMVRKDQRRGETVIRSYYVCSNYPGCKGMRPVE